MLAAAHSWRDRGGLGASDMRVERDHDVIALRGLAQRCGKRAIDWRQRDDVTEDGACGFRPRGDAKEWAVANLDDGWLAGSGKERIDPPAAAIRELRLMRRGDGSLYDVRVAGFKANLSDVLAAVALCQLDKIDVHTEIRRRHVEAYDAAVAELAGISPLARDPRDRHSLHLYVVRVDPEAAGDDRDAYQRALAEENIGTSIHFLPVHTLTYYREQFPDQPVLPIAERAGGEILSLPLSPAHSEEDIADAIEALRRVHATFTR